jgi:tetratricopeptide (TPR) repeat protein
MPSAVAAADLPPNTGIRFAATLLIVAAIVTIVHWPALSSRAISFDDTQYVTENALVLNPSWANAGRFLSEVRAPSTVRGYYQPLTMISLMADCAMGASVDNFVPFHRTSLALHVLNTMLVAVLLFLLFRHAWAAALVALLWGLHPLTIEPIPWLGERKTLLATFFALWSLVCYVKWCKSTQRRWFAGTAGFLLLALMSKPTTTPLPVLMLLLDIWPLRRLSVRSILEKIPLFLLAGVFAIITIVSQGNTASMSMPGQHEPMRVVYITAHNIVFYLRMLFFPHNLSSHYPFPDPLTPASGAVLAGVIGSTFLFAALAISLRWTRSVAVAWLFFFIAIFPTMGFIGFTNVIASDKYAYLPMIGFLLPLTALLAWYWPRETAGASNRLAIIAALLLLACTSEALAVRRQLAYWQTTELLFDRMIALAPRVPVLHNNYGVYLYSNGNKDKAFKEYQTALELSPDYADANRNVAMVLVDRNRHAEAIPYYETALNQINAPVDVKAKAAVHTNLAAALRNVGRIDDSITNCREAIRLNPTYSSAYITLGNTLRQAKRYEEAIAAIQEAIKLKPADAVGHNNLGAVLADLKRFEDAIAEYRRAIELNPAYAEPHTNMAISLEALKRPEEAQFAYREGIRLEPAASNAHIKLAESLRRAGKPQEALAEFLKIVDADPDNTLARRNAAFHLQEGGKLDEAIVQYREVLRREPADSDTRRNLALLYERQGKMDDALIESREAVHQTPKDAEARYTLAWLLEQKGQKDEARSEYTRVLELNATHEHARQRLAGLSVSGSH